MRQAKVGKMAISKRISISLITVSLLVGVASVPVTAMAQESEAFVIEEIVVTARRIEESLQDTPVTVTAITRQTIDDYRLDRIDDFVLLSPNSIVPASDKKENSQIAIRGGRFVDPQVEPDFGLYRNGQYYGGPRTNLSALVDLERVEIMRGPQVGLYGRNAMNGAVNLVFATPNTEAATGYASVTAARWERYEVEGWFNAPVSDTFAVRAAAWYYDQGEGEHFNITLNEELDEQDTIGGRLSASWQASDTVDVLWVLETNETDGPQTTEFIEEDRLIDPLGFGVNVPLPAETKRTIQRDDPSMAESETLYFSQDVNWSTDNGVVTFAVNYRDYEFVSTQDFDFTPFGVSAFPTNLHRISDRDADVTDTNVELRWASNQDQRLSWITGISYLVEDFKFSTGVFTEIDLSLIGFGPGVSDGTGFLVGDIDTDSYAAYAVFTYAATDRLDLIFGGRYTSDDKTLHYDQFIQTDDPTIVALFGPVFPEFVLDDSQTFDNFSPEVGLAYAINDNVNLFASYKEGFRAGSYNTTSTDPALLPYQDETATNFEIGIKSTLLDNRVRLNVTAFRFEIDDVLLRVLDPVNPLFSSLQNVGESETNGIEIEFATRPLEGLDIAAAVGWLDAEITSGEATDQGFAPSDPNISGSQIPYTRDWTGSLLLNFSRPVNSAMSWFVNSNYRFQSGGNFRFEPTNPPPGGFDPVPMDHAGFVNLSLGLETDRWRLVVFGDNITGDEPRTTLRFNELDRAEAETYGVRFSMNFE